MGFHRRLLLAALYVLHLLDGVTVVSDAEWAAYKIKYNKNYTLEDAYHRGLYDKKVVLVRNHNLKYEKGQEDYFMKLNEFSDTDQKVLYTYRSTIPPP